MHRRFLSAMIRRDSHPAIESRMNLGDSTRCVALVTATLLSAHLACTCHRRGLGRQIAEFAEGAPACAARLVTVEPSRVRPATYYSARAFELHWRRKYPDLDELSEERTQEYAWDWVAYESYRVRCAAGTPLLRWVRTVHTEGWVTGGDGWSRVELADL